MLEFYLIGLILEAAYDAVENGNLSREKPLVEGLPVELDGGNAVVHSLSFDEAVWDIHAAVSQYWGMGWDTHQLPPNSVHFLHQIS